MRPVQFAQKKIVFFLSVGKIAANSNEPILTYDEKKLIEMSETEMNFKMCIPENNKFTKLRTIAMEICKVVTSPELEHGSSGEF